MSTLKRMWAFVRWGLLFCGVALLLVLMRERAAQLIASPDGDFLQYWAAARLTLQGENPFILERVYALWRAEGWQQDWALVMYNPPWVLGLLLPLGALSARTAWGLWQGLLLALVLGAADVCWRWYGGAPRQRWVAWTVALTFMPALIAMRSGQMGVLVLSGLLVWVAGVRRGWDWVAGAGLALLSFKPHVLYLIWPAAVVWMMTTRRWRVAVAAVTCLALGAFLPSLWYPPLLRDYGIAVRTQPPSLWISPTWGTFLRLIWGPEKFFLQFVPTLLGGVGYTVYLWRRRASWDWLEEMPQLIALSLITRAYGWTHDLVTLIPVLIAGFVGATQGDVRALRRIGLAYGGATALMWAGQLLLPQGDHWLVWLPLLWAGWWWFAVKGWHRKAATPSGPGGVDFNGYWC